MPEFSFQKEMKPTIFMTDEVSREAIVREFFKEALNRPEIMDKMISAHRKDPEQFQVKMERELYNYVRLFKYGEGVSPEKFDKHLNEMSEKLVSYIGGINNALKAYEKIPEHLYGIARKEFLAKELRNDISETSYELSLGNALTYLNQKINPEAKKFQEEEQKRGLWDVANIKAKPVDEHKTNYTIQCETEDGKKKQFVLAVNQLASWSDPANKNFIERVNTLAKKAKIELGQADIKYIQDEIIKREKEYQNPK